MVELKHFGFFPFPLPAPKKALKSQVFSCMSICCHISLSIINHWAGLHRAEDQKNVKLDVNLVLNCCLQLLLWLQPELESRVFMQNLCLPLENCSFVHVNNVGV